MEENKDTIYDIESAVHPAEGSVAEELAKENESSDISDNSDNSRNSDNTEDPAPSEISENFESPELSKEPAMAEIERMVEDMGAETLLSIIKDNRNAAIRQIISEVEASRDRSLPSGSSTRKECSSIFDLAALA